MPFEIKLGEKELVLFNSRSSNPTVVVPMCVDSYFYTSKRLEALLVFCMDSAQYKGHNITLLVAGTLNRYNELPGQEHKALEKAQRLIEQIQDAEARLFTDRVGMKIQLVGGAETPIDGGQAIAQWKAIKGNPNIIKLVEWGTYLQIYQDEFSEALQLIQSQDEKEGSKIRTTLDAAIKSSSKKGKQQASRDYLKEEMAALLVFGRSEKFALHLYAGYLNSSQQVIYELMKKNVFSSFTSTLPKHVVFTYVDLGKGKDKEQQGKIVSEVPDKVTVPLHPMLQFALNAIKFQLQAIGQDGQVSDKQKKLFFAQIKTLSAMMDIQEAPIPDQSPFEAKRGADPLLHQEQEKKYLPPTAPPTVAELDSVCPPSPPFPSALEGLEESDVSESDTSGDEGRIEEKLIPQRRDQLGALFVRKNEVIASSSQVNDAKAGRRIHSYTVEVGASARLCSPPLESPDSSALLSSSSSTLLSSSSSSQLKNILPTPLARTSSGGVADSRTLPPGPARSVHVGQSFLVQQSSASAEQRSLRAEELLKERPVATIKAERSGMLRSPSVPTLCPR